MSQDDLLDPKNNELIPVELSPLDPVQIERELEEGGASENIPLSPDLYLFPLGRVSGFGVQKDGRPVWDLEALPASDLKLIREFLDKGHSENELIPE